VTLSDSNAKFFLNRGVLQEWRRCFSLSRSYWHNRRWGNCSFSRPHTHRFAALAWHLVQQTVTVLWFSIHLFSHLLLPTFLSGCFSANTSFASLASNTLKEAFFSNPFFLWDFLACTIKGLKFQQCQCQDSLPLHKYLSSETEETTCSQTSVRSFGYAVPAKSSVKNTLHMKSMEKEESVCHGLILWFCDSCHTDICTKTWLRQILRCHDQRKHGICSSLSSSSLHWVKVWRKWKCLQKAIFSSTQAGKDSHGTSSWDIWREGLCPLGWPGTWTEGRSLPIGMTRHLDRRKVSAYWGDRCPIRSHLDKLGIMP